LQALIHALLPGAVGGALIGLIQWLVMRERFGPVYRWTGLSIAATAVGWWAACTIFTSAVSGLIAFSNSSFMIDLSLIPGDVAAIGIVGAAGMIAGSGAGAVGGAIIGGTQWLMLRKGAPQALAIGWAVGLMAGWILIWLLSGG